MHAAALAFYKAALHDIPPVDVLEFGSCDLNGSVRDVCRARSWLGVDVAEGRGVDVVADAATFDAGRTFDMVICAEVFEHTPDWRLIVDNAYRHLNTPGLFVASCATADRPPHSAVDGGILRDGEYYTNVSLEDMEEHLAGMGWDRFEVILADGYFGNDDLYLRALK